MTDMWSSFRFRPDPVNLSYICAAEFDDNFGRHIEAMRQRLSTIKTIVKRFLTLATNLAAASVRQHALTE